MNVFLILEYFEGPDDCRTAKLWQHLKLSPALDLGVLENRFDHYLLTLIFSLSCSHSQIKDTVASYVFENFKALKEAALFKVEVIYVVSG